MQFVLPQLHAHCLCLVFLTTLAYTSTHRLYHIEPWHLFVQDVFNCLVLAETVYKVQEGNHAEVASTVSALRQDFPAPLISLQRLQWSLPHVLHR